MHRSPWLAALLAALAACSPPQREAPTPAPPGPASASASASAPASASAAASASPPPDPLLDVAAMAARGDLAGARAAFEKALGGSPVTAAPAPLPDDLTTFTHALEGVGFSRKGDAFAAVSAKGDEYRFELPTGAFRASMVPVEPQTPTPANLDDAPEISSAALSSEAHALLLRDRTPSWAPEKPDAEFAATQRSLARFRDRNPPTLENPARGTSKKLARRRPEPTIFVGTQCSDCRFHIEVSPDEGWLAANYGLSNDGVLRLFRLSSGAEVPTRGPYGGALSFDHRGRRLAVTMPDRVQVFQLEPHREVASVAAPEGDSARWQGRASWSPDDALLAVASEGQLTVVDAATGKARCQGNFGGPVAFSPSGKWLAATREGAPVLVQGADCGLVRATKGPAPASLEQLAFSPDETRLVALEPPAGLTIYDATSGAVALTIRLHAGVGAAISPDGHVELLGDPARAARLVSCQVRGLALPFELCQGRLLKPGLVASALGAAAGPGR